MSEVKKINVGAAITVPLALARRGGVIASETFQKHGVSEKFSALKAHPKIAKITDKADMLWTVLGLVLLFHGAQFKNLFFSTQVMLAFCFDRVKGSVLSLYSDVQTASEKMNEESKADAKAEPKPSDKKKVQEQDAATAKKMLKALDSDKVSSAAFQVCVSAMVCHMVMQGGLAQVIVLAHALVKASKEKINALLDFSGHEDLQTWTDSILSLLLYVVFGFMAVVASPLAFALSLAITGAQLVTTNGLRVAESMGRIPGGLSAEAFAASTKGLAMLLALTAFGTVWQFWALMADNGMGWYFKMLYIPAYTAEGIVGLF